MTSTGTPSLSNMRVGRFNLEVMIGEGPNGQVWRAREDLGLGRTRTVAVKFLPGGRLGDKKWIDRFAAEASYLMDFAGHSNIVEIVAFEVDPHRGPWLAMEFLPQGLQELMVDEPAPANLVRQLLIEVAQGLRTIHSAKDPLLHLDIKPGNILQDESGCFKITDFGCARPQLLNPTLNSVSFKYAAPELQGAALGKERPCTDLYSLGFCAYELACGNQQFRKVVPSVYGGGGFITGVTVAQERAGWVCWHADLKQAMPPLEQICPDLPKDISAAINKLIVKDPAQRYQSADALLDDLDASASPSVPQVRRSAPRLTEHAGTHSRSQRIALISGIGAVALLLTFAVGYWYITSTQHNAAIRDYDDARAHYTTLRARWDGLKLTDAFDHKPSRESAAAAERLVSATVLSDTPSLLQAATRCRRAAEMLEGALASADREEIAGRAMRDRLNIAVNLYNQAKTEFESAQTAWKNVKLVAGHDHKRSRELATQAVNFEPMPPEPESIDSLSKAANSYKEAAQKYGEALARAQTENMDAPQSSDDSELEGLTNAQRQMMAKYLHDGGLNTPDGDGHYLLQIAAARGRLDDVKALLAAGADINSLDRGLETPLHEAAREGRLDVVNQLLKHKPKLDEHDKEDGFTPLFKAIQGSHADVLKALLQAKASVNVLDNAGDTPLHFAIEHDFNEGVKLLIDSGADVSIVRKSDRYTALHQAAWNGDAEAVQLLIDKGAKIDALAVQGDTPLHIAAKANKLQAVKTLVEHGASMTSRNDDGKTPVDVAAREVASYFSERPTPPAK